MKRSLYSDEIKIKPIILSAAPRKGLESNGTSLMNLDLEKNRITKCISFISNV
jgi:hypothetical protein